MEQTKIETFDDLEIKINDGTGKMYNKVDYSKIVLNEGQPYVADCIGVKRAEVNVWQKPDEKKTVLRFLFRVIDENGETVVLSKDCNPSISYGASMRSNLFKVLKSLFPTVQEEELKDEGLVKARLADIALAEGKTIAIPCMIVIKKSQKGFLGIESVLAEPSVKKASIAKKQVTTGFESQNDYDKDEIPF